MEQQLVELILKHGLPCVIMAVIVMILVGIVKIFTKGITVDKCDSEKKKKWFSRLYLFLALVFSFGEVLFYHGVIAKIPLWGIDTIKNTAVVWTLTAPLYQIYKQFGGRKLLVWFTGKILSLFKGKDNKIDAIIETIMSIIGESAPLLTDNQTASIKARLEEEMGSSKKEDKDEENTDNAI